MPRRQSMESAEQRRERLERKVRHRIDAAAAEERALDEMVKRSISLHGA